MPGRKTKTTRGIAAEVLCEVKLRKKFAGRILDGYTQLIERQRATDLIFGVMRNHSVIDLIIEKVSACPIARVHDKVLNIIRVGVYEIIYCPETAEYAIVNEAVDSVKKIANAKQSGFVNAVLRRTLRHISNRQIRLEQAPPSKTIPQTADTGCEFDIEILPDSNASISRYLSSVFSLPGWLVKSWLDEYGREQTEKICFASNRRPSVYLRPNPQRTTIDELTGKLRAGGVDCQVTGRPQMIKLTSPKAITALPGFDGGLFTVQDLSAAEATGLLKPQPGWTILDLCAAPGTKTTQLAEATAGWAKISATDIDSSRLDMVRENVARLGLADCVTVIEYNAVYEWAKKFGGFDCILVDAPCSNTGVLARRPEVRLRITKKAVGELAKTQLELLSKVIFLLKSRGFICYSTCSIQPQENGLLIRGFIQRHPEFKLKSEKLVLPSAQPFDCDGAYAAVIAKQSSAG
jgi:16S rRNA (cytosine967-C5)-methyltransferase